MATRSGKKSKAGGLTPEEAFGVAIKERRIELGYTQADLEVLAQIGRSYISELESGTKQVCLRPLLRLAFALDLDPEELLARTVLRTDSKIIREMRSQG